MINRSFTVAVSVERAFAAWTARIDLWWPPNHRPGKGVGVIVLEPEIGGRFLHRDASGNVVELGRVTTWEPPHHLSYAFYLGSSADEPSQVHIAFHAEGDSTRVDIEHGRGALSEERWAGTNGGFSRAWNHLIEAFPSFIESKT